MGLLSSLLGRGGGGDMPMPPMEGLAGALGGGGSSIPSIPMPQMSSPPPLPMGGRSSLPPIPSPVNTGNPGISLPALNMPQQQLPGPMPLDTGQNPIRPIPNYNPNEPTQMQNFTGTPIGDPEVIGPGRGGMAPRPGVNPNSIPGGPATSWRPQSVGQLISQGNNMLSKSSWDQLQGNPQFQKIMQNLDGSILKNVPNDSKASILDNIGNLRSQLGNQTIPQIPGQAPQMQIGNQIADNRSVPLMPGQTAAPLQIGSKFAPDSQVPLLPGQTSVPQARNVDYMNTGYKMLGYNERQHADILNKFFKQTLGYGVDLRNTAWCSAFVNGVLYKNGLQGTNNLMARSFMGYGVGIKPQDAMKGDIVIFGRGKAPYGHVGFVDSVNLKNGTVRVLSGNQNNAVTLKDYNIDKALGFRRMKIGK